jgi:hypothetical protein
MEEMIGGALVESALFNILAENADALLVAASKEIWTAVMMRVLRRMFTGLFVELLRHDDPQKDSGRIRAVDDSG